MAVPGGKLISSLMSAPTPAVRAASARAPSRSTNRTTRDRRWPAFRFDGAL